MRQYACSYCIDIVQYASYDKNISALEVIISNDMQNVDLIVAMHSALCSSMLVFKT